MNKTANEIRVDRDQGINASGHTFGYVFIGDGGFFFDWQYDRNANHSEQVRQIVATLNADTIDPPTGRGDLRAKAERDLRAHIRERGILR